MEKLLLETGKEYVLAVGGFCLDDNYVKLKIVSEETLEQIKEIFSNATSVAVMKVINGDVTQAIIENFTERGNQFILTENELIGSSINETGVEHTYGNTIEFCMYKKSIENVVEHNRADIDYLMMMEGE